MQYPKTAKVLEFERTHPSKRKQNGLLDGDFTPAERREAQTWAWPTWLKGTGPEGDENAKLLNAGIFWLGCLLTHENLNTLCQSAELAPLFNVIRPPEPRVVTPDERTAAEAELALHDKSWRGDGRDTNGAPFAIAYNSVENLDKIVAYVSKECFGVATWETFLAGFHTLLTEGKLTPMKKEARPTHNPPATPASVRAAREADANKHADTRQSVKELRETRSKFLTDYNAVRDFHGTGMSNGLRSYAAKYTGQKEGLKQLKLKWDGKFQGEDLKGYIKMVQDLERDIEKLSPSGGTIKINDKNDRANEGRSGGTITDVPVTADAEAARQEHNRQLLSGNVTNTKKPVQP